MGTRAFIAEGTPKEFRPIAMIQYSGTYEIGTWLWPALKAKASDARIRKLVEKHTGTSRPEPDLEVNTEFDPLFYMTGWIIDRAHDRVFVVHSLAKGKGWKWSKPKSYRLGGRAPDWKKLEKKYFGDERLGMWR